MTMSTKGEGLRPCLLFTSATRGLLTCNDTNFFMVQSLPNPWRCILIKQLQVPLYASHLHCLFSPSHHSLQPAHLSTASSEVPQSPQLSQPLIQITIHPRPLRNARRYFIQHKQSKWWEQVVLNGKCAQYQGFDCSRYGGEKGHERCGGEGVAAICDAGRGEVLCCHFRRSGEGLCPMSTSPTTPSLKTGSSHITRRKLGSIDWL